MIKIADAAARIREQHDWCARTAKCAFQRRVTDLDRLMLLQILPPRRSCENRLNAPIGRWWAILGLAACAHVEQRGRGDADRCGDEEIATIPWDLYAVRPHGAMLGRATLIEGECGIRWSARTS